LVSLQRLFWLGSQSRVGFAAVDAVGLGADQLGNTDQVIGDQVEQEGPSDAVAAAMFVPAQRAMLLAPAEDAFDHRPARLRHAIALLPRGASVDGVAAVLAG
jgi:hypothetical protein